MLVTMRLLLLAVSFAAFACGDDITIPMDGGGSIQIRNPQFIRVDQFNIFNPELTFSIVDNSSAEWKVLKLQFDIGGFCAGETRQWSATVYVFRPDRYHRTTIESLRNKLQFCQTEIIKARRWEPGCEEHPNLTQDETREHKAKREARAAEDKRLAAIEKAKKDTADAEERALEDARKRRRAAEQKKKQAEADAHAAQLRAEREAKAAEELRRFRLACAEIYRSTIDKKRANLTVREEEQTQACRALGLYPPR